MSLDLNKLPPRIALTPAQEDAIDKVFSAAASEESGDIESVQAPGLIAQLLLRPISEEMLETVETITEHVPKLNLTDFTALVSTVLARTTHWGRLKTPTTGRVGFDTIGDQQLRKSLKRGFEFNILIIGESGLGKSTMLDTLFQGSFSRRTCTAPGTPYVIPDKTVEIHTVTHVVDESGVRLRLAVTDTPGFGDQINNADCWRNVEAWLQEQFERYYHQENQASRPTHIPDTRAHVCLYFIAPTGHSLKALDVECIRRLSRFVTIVPVIAKADLFTLEERAAFKQRIREDLEHARVPIFPYPRDDDEKEDTVLSDRLRDLAPFAVVGCNASKSVDGRPVRGRQTKFGFVEVENPAHCDFAALRDMLIRTHLHDLKEVTVLHKYEEFRREKLLRDSMA